MTERAEQANKVQAATRQAMDAIRTDPSLSDVGRQQALARVWHRAQQQLAALGQADAVDARDRLRQVEARVFGIGTAYASADKILAARDAAARAESVPRDRLERAYRAAVRRGDDVMARAVVARAVEEGVRSVIAAATAEDPQLARDVEQLDQLADTVAGGGPAGRIQRNMTFGLPMPREVAGMGQRRVEALAQADDLTSAAGDAA